MILSVRNEDAFGNDPKLISFLNFLNEVVVLHDYKAFVKSTQLFKDISFNEQRLVPTSAHDAIEPRKVCVDF